MKVACDRCEKVVSVTGREYMENWRRIFMYRPFDPVNPVCESACEPVNQITLCADCYDKAVDFLDREFYLKHEENAGTQ